MKNNGNTTSPRFFRKRFGFAPSPQAVLEGYYEVFSDKVVARMSCRSCGRVIELNLWGQTKCLTTEQIRFAVRARALQRHECPAVKAELENNSKDYFADILRGKEKIDEAEFQKKKRGTA